MLKGYLFWKNWQNNIFFLLIWFFVILVVNFLGKVEKIPLNKEIVTVDQGELINEELRYSKLNKLVEFLNRFDNEFSEFSFNEMEGDLFKVKLTGEAFDFSSLAELLFNLRRYYRVDLVKLHSKFPYIFQLEVFYG